MDELTALLHDICRDDGGGFNLDLFEEICLLNGVDLSAYDRTRAGWQGRIRTVGRNLIAKKVHYAGGIVVLPMTIHGGVYRISDAWLRRQRFKAPPKVERTGLPKYLIGVRTK